MISAALDMDRIPGGEGAGGFVDGQPGRRLAPDVGVVPGLGNIIIGGLDRARSGHRQEQPPTPAQEPEGKCSTLGWTFRSPVVHFSRGLSPDGLCPGGMARGPGRGSALPWKQNEKSPLDRPRRSCRRVAADAEVPHGADPARTPNGRARYSNTSLFVPANPEWRVPRRGPKLTREFGRAPMFTGKRFAIKGTHATPVTK